MNKRIEDPAEGERLRPGVTTKPTLLAARSAILVLGMGLGLGLTGCSLAPAPVGIGTLEALPGSYSDQAAVTESPAPAAMWWSSFEDPTLNLLVASALASNLDIVEAVGRVEEVRAQYRIARSGLFPTVQAGGDFTRFDQPANAGQFGAIFGAGNEGEGETPGDAAPDVPDRFAFSTFGASLGLSYELDFWSRIRSGRDAGMAELLATGADLSTVQISVAAETISAYFELRELAQRQDVLAQQIELLTERLALTEERYDRGVVTSLELYRIRQDLNATQSRQPLLGSQTVSTRGRLALLLGRYPDEVTPMLEGDHLPVVQADPMPAGLPASLLQNRPDLQAAAFRLEASRQRVGERAAARLPSISLTGSVGQQSSELSDLLRADQWFTNFVTSLTAPIFFGGRLKADQEAAQARYEQEAARYARSVLTAFQEVDASLATFNAERDRKVVLDGQLDAARSAAAIQLRRLDLGIGDYVAYLDALRTVLNVEETLATAERDLANARLAVHRALGGSWIEDAAQGPEPDAEGPNATDRDPSSADRPNIEPLNPGIDDE